MKQNRRRNKALDLTWPDNYYAPVSGEERYKFLDAAIQDEDSEANRFRLKLWEYRYGAVAKNKGKPKMDGFMKLWMDLKFASGRTNAVFGVKSVIKEIKKDIKSLGFSELDQYDEVEKDLLYKELVQAGQYYLELCASDKSYNTELFGLKQISDEHFEQKIINDVYSICYMTPSVFDLQKELELFTKAVTEALEKDYPELIPDLNAAVEKMSQSK